jgi:hypothetical protein
MVSARDEPSRSASDAAACDPVATPARDAYAALHYLGAQSFVAADRVAVMAYSMDGAAALIAVEQERTTVTILKEALLYDLLPEGEVGLAQDRKARA